MTILSRPATGILNANTCSVIWFKAWLTGLMPQAQTNSERMMNGAQARKIWPPVKRSSCLPRLFGSSGKCQLSFGCQNFRKTTVHTIEASEAMMSGSSGAVIGELAEKYWAMAKEPPLTKQAGHTSQPFFQPDMTMTR